MSKSIKLVKKDYSSEVRQNISLKSSLYQISNNKADRLGLNFPDYIRYLLVKDNEVELTNMEFLSDEDELSLAEAMKEVENNSLHTFASTQELVADV